MSESEARWLSGLDGFTWIALTYVTPLKLFVPRVNHTWHYANPDCEFEQPQDCGYRGLPHEYHSGDLFYPQLLRNLYQRHEDVQISHRAAMQPSIWCGMPPPLFSAPVWRPEPDHNVEAVSTRIAQTCKPTKVPGNRHPLQPHAA